MGCSRAAMCQLSSHWGDSAFTAPLRDFPHLISALFANGFLLLTDFEAFLMTAPPPFKVTLGTKKFFFLVHECAEGILLTTVCVL